MEQIPLVVDPRFTAGRGAEFSAAAIRDRQEQALAQLDDFHVPIDFTPQDQVETESIGLESIGGASEDVALAEDNKGFQMLQRMGWKQGTGLGRERTGIVEPIKSSADAGMRLGLGKMEQIQYFVAPENVNRKKLESEIQAEEDEQRTQRREALVQQQQRIQQDVTEAKRTFYCEVCHKQYKTAMEMENHLSSYDHHHTKRLKEMKAMTAGRQRGEKERKEKRRVEKELAKLNAQYLRAQQQQQAALAAQSDNAHPLGTAATPLQHQPLPDGAPPLPPEAPPPPPEQPPLPTPPLPGREHPNGAQQLNALGSSRTIQRQPGAAPKQVAAFSGKVGLSLAARKAGAIKLAAFNQESSDDE